MNSKLKLLKMVVAISLLFSYLAMLHSQVFAQEDDRQLIQISPDIKDRFLAEMRKDLAHLDDILSAMAEGNMEEVAQIAERKMGLAHKRIEKMENMGASDSEIGLFITRIRKMAESEEGNLTKKLHTKGQGEGVGQFMPEELRAMGQEMHKSAYELADIARSAKKPPTAIDYKNLFSALNTITTHCRGCHDTFRVR